MGKATESKAALTALCFFAAIACSSTDALGINYGRVADNLPPPATVAAFVKSQNIAEVRIFDADAGVLAAFANSGVRVTVTLADVAGVAASTAAAQAWVASNVLPYGTIVSTIIVGNEVLKYSPDAAPLLAPAMTNIRSALTSSGATAVRVSTAVAMDVLASSFPPSAGAFTAAAASSLKPVLEFLSADHSPLLINAYPYFAYRDDAGATISLEYALGTASGPVITDSATGLSYFRLLDAQVDAVYAAVEKLVGSSSVAVAASETGWATSGGFGATVANAAAYNRNLVARAAANQGTPRHPELPVDAFIFSLFDENLKPGGDDEKRFGVFNADMTPVYDITFGR